MTKLTRILAASLSLFTIHYSLFSALPNEPHDPNPPCTKWSQLKTGTAEFSFDTSGVRAKKHAPPAITVPLKQLSLTTWKNEQSSAQLLLWTTEPLKDLRLEVTKLTSADGASTPATIEPFSVRYLLTDEFGSNCARRYPGQFKTSLAPDILDPSAALPLVNGNSTRPFWLTIKTPADAKPGTFTANITLHATRNDKPFTRTLTLNLTILDRTLTNPSQWPFHLDFWQHPGALARVEKLTPWSDEHFAQLRPLMKRLADAGQKVITATLNKDPWNHQCYDAYDSMILWTKKSDGTFTYDYTAFDKWVQLMLDLGVNRQINCYSAIPWNNELEYFDEAQNKTITISAPPGTPEFETLWLPFIKNFRQHLQQKNWFKIARIAMDERDAKSMQAAIDFFTKHVPDFPIALADNKKAYTKFPNLADMSIAYDKPIEQEYLSQRKKAGYITTYYIYCRTKLPNTFTFSPPAEASFLPWHAIANNYDGVLRWSYNSWTENPLTDSRFISWPAGDTYIVYPGNLSSVRFESLIEGMQDVEKFRLLKAEFEKSGNSTKLAILNQLLQPFTPLLSESTNTRQLIDQTRTFLNLLSQP